MLRALFASLVLATFVTIAASAQTDPGPADRVVRIEPYTGPAILLPEGDPPIEGQETARDVVKDFYDPETQKQVRIEREAIAYSDGSFKNGGFYREFYRNGQLFCEGQYNLGVETGDWAYYHEDGKVAKKLSFVDGKPNGPVELFDAEGKPVAKRNYEAGNRVGTWVLYNPGTDQVIREENYKAGKLDGPTKVWFTSGKLRQESNFKDGLPDGVAKEWDDQGVLRAEVNFVAGKREGLATLWTADGKKIEQTFKDNVLVTSQSDKK